MQYQKPTRLSLLILFLQLRYVGIILVLLQGVGSIRSFAAEQGSESNAFYTRNSGFVEHPSLTLNKRFPMCDVFLKVEWLNAARRLGYARYETLLRPTSLSASTRTMSVVSVVNMGYFYSIDYDVSWYEKNGRLHEILGMVKDGTVDGVFHMVITHKGATVHLHPGIQFGADELTHPLLSDNLQTVCVPYPDEKTVWIVEGRSVERIYGGPRQLELFTKMKDETKTSIGLADFGRLWVLDINGDGVEDYVAADSFFYSTPRGYFFARLQPNKTTIGTYSLRFPSSRKACSLKYTMNAIVSDGRAYQLLGYCHLTKMTSEDGKE